MMYVINSTRVTTSSLNSAPDLDALASGRALVEGSCDDSASLDGRPTPSILNAVRESSRGEGGRRSPTVTLNPSRGCRISSAAHNTLGRVADDVLTSSYAQVSIGTTSSNLNGTSPLTPHLRANAKINNKGLHKSCQKILLNVQTSHTLGH